MPWILDNLPARKPIVRLLEQALPGCSAGVNRLREQTLEFAASPTARTVLLRGPIGSGKSTVARLIGFLKRVAPLTEVAAARRVLDIRYDGPNRVDSRLMPWYVELALTGLTETLAETQLFGSTKGAYTGAVNKPGVFEMAQRERGAGGLGAGALLTGGVVFLDEIGELPQGLQAKLLPVLSGGVFYRVGGEGHEDYATRFSGVTVAASWRRLDAGLLRPDLLSRVSSYVIDVPGMDEREEDFDVLLAEAERIVIASLNEAIERLCIADPETERAYWRGRKEAVVPIDERTARRLRDVDWSRHGNLRGLTDALEQMLVAGRDVEDVLGRLPIIGSDPGGLTPSGLLSRLLTRKADGSGLASHVRAIEVEARQALSDVLLDDASIRKELATELGIGEDRLTYQAQQLPRSRVRRTKRSKGKDQ